jgi:ABC-type transport system substrate-binding protein
LGINNTQSPFENQQVRQALAMGIDRQRVVDAAFPQGYQLAEFFTPCVIPHGCVGEPWYTFDPQRARQLLSEAGFPDGFETELAYREIVRGFLPRPDLAAKEIQAQLRENLNISARLNPMEPDAFLEAVDTGSLPGLHLLGWGADYPDVSNFLDSHFSQGASAQFGSKFDDLTGALEQGAAEAGDEARRPFYEAANNAIREHVPLIPIAHGGWASPNGLAVAYAKDVEGAHASPLGLEDFSLMHAPGHDRFVWMQAAEPLSLDCANETDIESLRACAQVVEPLYRFEAGGVTPIPALAETCEPNDDLTVWTCQIRQGVSYHDGSRLDANDVVTSWGIQWDAAHPLHNGNYAYFKALWGAFMNAAQP